jgi:alkylhydroperoxidase family enzyme
MNDKQRDGLQALLDGIPMMVQAQVMLAQVTRAKYDALRKEGFSEAQAIELCKGSLLPGSI